MIERDPYSLLGVAPGASSDEVRQAALRMTRLVHPDRFDPIKQAREWRDANDLLMAVNEAHAVLRDPARRAEYDRRRGRAHEGAPRSDPPKASPPKPPQPPPRAAEPPPAQRQPPRPPPRPSAAGERSKEPSHGCASFLDLPKRLRERLVDRQAGRLADNAWVTTERPWRPLIGGFIFAGLFIGLMVMVHGGRQTVWSVLAVSLVVLWAGLGLGWYLDYVVKWFLSPLKPRLYAVPLYLVETRFDEIRWWPIPIGHSGYFKATHHLTSSGFHEFTTVEVAFGNSSASFRVASQEAANRLVAALNSHRDAMQRAAEAQDWEYFERNEDFRGLAGEGRHSGRFASRRHALAATTAAVFAVYALVVLTSATRPHSSPASISESLPAKTFRVRLRTPGYYRGEWADLSHTDEALLQADLADLKGEYEAWLRTNAVQELPANGAVQRFHASPAVAPFEVHTRGTDHQYLVKLVSASTGQDVATVFIRAGQSVKVEVPLGTMRMRYAAGPANQPWYGDTILFGPSTEFFEADSDFVFSREGERIEGYTVELFLQRDGNLQKRKIAPEQW